MKQALTITDRAANRIQDIMAAAAEKGEAQPPIALRVGVKSTGCSGHSYYVEYAHDQKQFEEVVEDKGVKLFVDAKSIMYLLGTELDFVESKMGAEFIFNNPNEASRCGCGESFSVKN